MRADALGTFSMGGPSGGWRAALCTFYDFQRRGLHQSTGETPRRAPLAETNPGGQRQAECRGTPPDIGRCARKGHGAEGSDQCGRRAGDGKRHAGFPQVQEPKMFGKDACRDGMRERCGKRTRHGASGATVGPVSMRKS